MANSRGQINTTSSSGSSSMTRRRRTPIEPTHKGVHDIVCIGFGYNAISLAIALEESHQDSDVLFLERQSRSTYVPFNRLAGPFMQLSFLNDLVTLENPRSRFSYVNYLHSTDQLTQFTNLGSIQPLREQFARYLGWCADKFETRVRYGSEVQAVRPIRIHESSVNAWSVEYVDVETGRFRTTLAKQVVCAVGPQIHLPELLNKPDISSSVYHSSSCLEILSTMSKDLTNEYHVVIIGNGQEAAEIVERICSMQNSHQVIWIQEARSNGVADIDEALSHRLYEIQYSQRVRESDEKNWTLHMYPNTDLKSAYRSLNGKIHLSCTGSNSDSRRAEIVCDFIIAATGYGEPQYKQLLRLIQDMLHGDKLTSNRHMGVNLKAEIVDRNRDIWVLDPHQHGDKSLAQTATRSRFLADSILKKLRESPNNGPQIQPRL